MNPTPCGTPNPADRFQGYRTPRVAGRVTFRLAGAGSLYRKWLFHRGGMNTPTCPVCGRVMTRYGHAASEAQRWRCSPCNFSQVSRINSAAKHLDEFVAWLLGRRRQGSVCLADLGSGFGGQVGARGGGETNRWFEHRMKPTT